LGEADEVLSSTTSIQEGEDDEDITTSDITIPSIELQGPITRSRAQQLRRQVNLFLCSSANDHENRLLPNELIIFRNQGVDHGEHEGHQEGVGEPRKHTQHGGSPSQFGIQESDFESVLGVQNHLAFKLAYRTRLTSDLCDLHMHGNIRR
jgi:hypothetical protein